MTAPGFQAQVATTTEVPNTREMRIRGRVTLNESPELRRRILDEIEQGHAKRIVLELGGVEEMDTSGAAVLAEVLKVGRDKGMRVLLCGPSESVLRIFRLAGFEDVLEHCCAGWEETRRRLLE